MTNIKYKTDQIEKYFSTNRVVWSDLYESEKIIINDLTLNGDTQVLDIGCGCGGLGIILRDKFGVKNYTGIEINELAAYSARRMNPEAKIYAADFLSINNEFKDKNIDFIELLSSNFFFNSSFSTSNFLLIVLFTALKFKCVTLFLLSEIGNIVTL